MGNCDIFQKLLVVQLSFFLAYNTPPLLTRIRHLNLTILSEHVCRSYQGSFVLLGILKMTTGGS